MLLSETLAEEFNIDLKQVEAIIGLFDEGNAIPFLAIYRKEITGSLTDKFLRKFRERLTYLKNLDKMKEIVIETIKKQDKLTESLEEHINQTTSLLEIEGIFRPFVSKEKTKADIAEEKGLSSLANIIRFQKTEIPIVKIAEDYVDEEKGVGNIQEAISGAQDIIAEIIRSRADFMELIQKITFEEGELSTIAIDKDSESPYEMYYDKSEALIDISNHRVLAINRGEEEDFLKVEVIAPEEDIISYLNRHFLIDNSDDYSGEYNELTREYMEEAILRAYNQLIAPSVQEGIRNYLTMRAENKSLELFSDNLESLLMQGPIRNKVVLGWNPSSYSGSKLVVVDEIGEVLDTKEIYLQSSQSKLEEGMNIVSNLLKEYNVDIIALGDSIDSKRFEEIIVEIIKGTNVKYALVNQAGASVYSESDLAEIEFPDFDKGYRNAISLARRLQDPLVELVKIDPKSIGVGQYQYDLNQEILNDALNDVVERVVNNIGVDLNSASISLLSHVAGLNLELASSIVDYRNENGPFTSRYEILEVEGIDFNIFKQCSAFLKVYTSNNHLDFTKIHPESYEIAEKLLKKFNYTIKDIGSPNLSFKTLKKDLKEYINESMEENINGEDLINVENSNNKETTNNINNENSNKNNKEDTSTDRNNEENISNNKNTEEDASADRNNKNETSTDENNVNDTNKENTNKSLNKSTTDTPSGKWKYIDNITNDLKITNADLNDMILYLEDPYEDPRDFMPKPILRGDMLSIEDLKLGMELEGAVRNVVDFGAFVDIGVQRDGLVHISKMSQGKFINHPSDIVNIGDVIKVKIIELDLDRNKIQLALVID